MPFIYRIFDKDTNESIYIGSCTRKYLWERRTAHKYDYYHKPENPLYNHMRKNKDWDGYVFEIIEEFEKINKEDLLLTERKWIEKLHPICNIVKPIITRDELLQVMRDRANQKVHCSICLKEVSYANLSRHMKLVHPA